MNQLDTRRLRLAMGVKAKNMHYRLHDIQRRHFNHMARLCGWGENMEGLIKFHEDIVDSLEQAPQAFIGMLNGSNFAKLVVRIANE